MNDYKLMKLEQYQQREEMKRAKMQEIRTNLNERLKSIERKVQDKGQKAQ